MGEIIGKFTSMLTTIVIISIITFMVFQVLPGDPALIILGTEASPEAVAAVRVELGLNEPLPTRLFSWFKGILLGDFGDSYRFHEPVLELIGQSLQVTIMLALYSMLLAVIIAIPLGIIAALNQGRVLDHVTLVFGQLGLAIPSFWLGTMLMLVFATIFRVFDTGGYIPFSQDWLAALKALTLPAIALALPRAAIITRITRTTMLEVLAEDYIRTAKAKGLSKYTVVIRHALKNALIPIITLIGLQFGGLLAGAIILEQVFMLPGLGTLLLSALGARDIPLMQGIVFFITTSVVLINYLTDLSYGLIDPRVDWRGQQ